MTGIDFDSISNGRCTSAFSRHDLPEVLQFAASRLCSGMPALLSRSAIGDGGSVVRLVPGRASLRPSQVPAQDLAERLLPKQGRQASAVEEFPFAAPGRREREDLKAGCWMSSTADAGSRQRRHWILQGVHLHRQQGELTGYSFQIRLLRCRALRERRQHSCVLLLRHLNIPQSRPDDRIWYWDWDWSRLGWRLCSDPIEIRRREAAEVRQRETIKLGKEKSEVRQGDTTTARKSG